MVEQKEVIHRFMSKGDTTVQAVMRGLAVILSRDLRDFVRQATVGQKAMVGEQGYYKMMADTSEKGMQSLTESLSKPANLEKLREYLKQKGVPFAFHENKARTSTDLLYRVRDKAVVENALGDLVNDLHKDPDMFTKDPTKTHVSEQVTKETKAQKQKPVMKAKPKAPVR